jgi:23S rRNA (pseudouridine1915-N3)-methyltransferase
MKMQLVTIGKPKLAYAVTGWGEYMTRLQRIHSVTVLHISDKHAYDATKILHDTAGTTRVILDIEGASYTSPQLATFLQKRELESKPVSFIIGGPEGLPQVVRDSADFLWSLGPLTLPHDLAMVVALEALYRASSINLGLPYHK